MSKQNTEINSFIKELLRRQGKVPRQLALDIGVSHASVSRWLSGKDIPKATSCCKLAEYADVPCEEVLIMAGHMPKGKEARADELPVFRDYAHLKYPKELDEDLIHMIEDLIERRRQRRHN
jgi:transcriptional regulator with XRE-family HTH domain